MKAASDDQLGFAPDDDAPIRYMQRTRDYYAAIADITEGRAKKGEVPPLWDGHATERVFDVIETL